MQIGVPKETWPGEVRAAMVPANASKLINQGFTVEVQSGVGDASGYSDADYVNAGARVSEDRSALLAGADIVMAVRKPDAQDVSLLKRGALYISFLDPFNERAKEIFLLKLSTLIGLAKKPFLPSIMVSEAPP